MRLSQPIHSLCFWVRRFRAATAGSMSVEAAIVLPLLIWWYVAAFQFFEAYRERATNVKAAFTLADMITRETLPVDGSYIDGMGKVFAFLTNSDEATWIRVTSVKWKVEADKDGYFEVQWSYATRSHTPHTDSSLDALKSQIPNMSPNDTVVIVETHSSLVPIFEIGISDLDFDQFVVMRPRFVPTVLWGDRSASVSG